MSLYISSVEIVNAPVVYNSKGTMNNLGDRLENTSFASLVIHGNEDEKGIVMLSPGFIPSQPMTKSHRVS